MSPDTDDASTPRPEGPPPWLGALAQACGDEVFRYCAAMLGDDAATGLLPQVLADVIEHEARREAGAEVDLDELRLTALAVAHNQCVERGRQGQRPPLEWERDAPDERRALRALARLRPIGRDVTILRQGVGMRWSTLQRVCGEPRARLVLQTCRAWRRLRHFAEDRGGTPPVRRPKGRRLSGAAPAWAAIREDARGYVEVRAALRRAIEHGPTPAPGWVDEVWPTVERARDRRRQEAERKAKEQAEAQAQAQARSRARDEAERAAEAQAERAAKEAAEAKARAEAQAEASAAAEQRRAGIRRWMMIGVVLAVVGLLARWVAIR